MCFVTILIPCRDEAANLGLVLAGVREAHWEGAIPGKPGHGEVIVVDNGSVDLTAVVARDAGALVVQEPVPGYGRALRTGVVAASGEYVVFVDGDGEHPVELVPVLLRAVVAAGADVGVGSRLRGRIEPGAMPWLHRYVGTPVLTWLLNRLHGGRFTDGMSGLRCVRRQWFLEQDFRADGMEFASEMLIVALQSGAGVVEIPGGMNCGPKGRRSHLRTWRDGWRHLRLIVGARWPFLAAEGAREPVGEVQTSLVGRDCRFSRTRDGTEGRGEPGNEAI